MKQRIQSFTPIIDESAVVLILGSIPGNKSIEKQEYYAHPQNQFWKLLFEVFSEENIINYTDKIEFLKRNKLALWDIISSCEREGSLDSNIKNETLNEISKLLKNYVNIKVIFCNGQKSYKNVIKLLGKNYHLPIILMPSTSPLHTISFDKKLDEWMRILEFF